MRLDVGEGGAEAVLLESLAARYESRAVRGSQNDAAVTYLAAAPLAVGPGARPA